MVGVAALFLRPIFFPQLAIDIGRSGELVRRAAGRRQLAFTLLVVTLIGGVAASILADYLSPG
jgi:hypothetical protein